MSIEDRMTIDERRKYLRKMQERYFQADRKERGRLLDEMEAVTELHRKSLIRLLHSNLARRPRRRQRGRTYGPEVDDALRVIAESTDYICAERLRPNLTWLAKHLAAHGELEASPRLLEQLERISVSTVGRILARIRQDEPRLPRRRPRPTNRLTRDVPMRRIPWQEQEPGHFEVDLVHHSGPSASGEYVCTIQMVDVATGWSERVAIMGRSYLVVEDGFNRILARLPFPVREVHPDNGSEFFNHHMLRFWHHLEPQIQLSRSRPYHKNDNRFVEQKNSTLVRAYLGYDRLDTVAQTLAVNQLYGKMWLYYNLKKPWRLYMSYGMSTDTVSVSLTGGDAPPRKLDVRGEVKSISRLPLDKSQFGEYWLETCARYYIGSGQKFYLKGKPSTGHFALLAKMFPGKIEFLQESGAYILYFPENVE